MTVSLAFICGRLDYFKAIDAAKTGNRWIGSANWHPPNVRQESHGILFPSPAQPLTILIRYISQLYIAEMLRIFKTGAEKVQRKLEFEGPRSVANVLKFSRDCRM